MPGPGTYGPDATEGITRVEDLPAPRIVDRSRNYPSRTCPRCGGSAYRLRTAQRTPHDLGDPVRRPAPRPARDLLAAPLPPHPCRN